MMPKKNKNSVDCRILWRPITHKICVAQKNVVEEKLLEIERSISSDETIPKFTSIPIPIKCSISIPILDSSYS